MVTWTDRARENLRDIVAYISRDSQAAADRVLDRIFAATAHLADHPQLGRAGRIDGTRELVIPRTRYIVPYRVHGGDVEILAVIHSSRSWPESLD
jgi:toxin ParE1/3/4